MSPSARTISLGPGDDKEGDYQAGRNDRLKEGNSNLEERSRWPNLVQVRSHFKTIKFVRFCLCSCSLEYKKFHIVISQACRIYR
jgi:hypothetical protein